MDVILRPRAKDAIALCARIVDRALRERPNLTLGLATGRTMEPLYALLAESHIQCGLDFSRCRFFALDEYVGLEPSDNRSYRYYLESHLLKHINADSQNACFPNGLAGDLEAAARTYEEAISEAGGIDLQILGLGRNGHIAFNEPGSSLRSRTREVRLARETLEQNADPFDGDPDQVPTRALTMGVATILESKRCVLLATGGEKKTSLAAAVEGPVTSTVPASALQRHPNCLVIADEAAGSRLQRRSEYRKVFEHAPTQSLFHPDPEGTK